MRHEPKGYTLIELTVVVFLLGLMLSLTVPTIQQTFLHDDLLTATRRIVGTAKGLREKAIREQRLYKLFIDMEADAYWAEGESTTPEERSEARDHASRLPGNVRFLDVYRPAKGKKEVGGAVIHFMEEGHVEPAVIHLGTKDGRAETIALSPFLGKPKVYGGYVDIEGA